MCSFRFWKICQTFMRTTPTKWALCRKAIFFALCVECCASGIEDLWAPCWPLPQNVQIIEYIVPCCFDKDSLRYTFIEVPKEITWYTIDFAHKEKICCYVDVPQREYTAFMTDIYSRIQHIRDSVTSMFPAINHQRPPNYDIMNEFQKQAYSRKQAELSRLRELKEDSVYCLVVDSLENSWMGPQYQKFDIPPSNDCRLNHIEEMRNRCMRWARATLRPAETRR